MNYAHDGKKIDDETKRRNLEILAKKYEDMQKYLYDKMALEAKTKKEERTSKEKIAKEKGGTTDNEAKLYKERRNLENDISALYEGMTGMVTKDEVKARIDQLGKAKTVKELQKMLTENDNQNIINIASKMERIIRINRELDLEEQPITTKTQSVQKQDIPIQDTEEYKNELSPAFKKTWNKNFTKEDTTEDSVARIIPAIEKELRRTTNDPTLLNFKLQGLEYFKQDALSGWKR